MARRQGKMKREAEKALPQEAKAESHIEAFEKKWGMDLTEPETQQIIERAMERVREADGEVKMKPALRDEMFALLIEKDPAKAISLRMRMHEKRGAQLSAEQKNRVKEVAEVEGWRAAMAELNSVMKAKKSGKESVPSGREEAAKRRVRAGMERKKAEPKAQAQEKTGTRVSVEGEAEARNAYRLAMQKNRELKGVVLECKRELMLLKEEYYGKGGKMEGASEKKGEALLAKYQRESRKIQGKYESRANALKEERDSYAKRYIRAGTMSMVGAEKMGDHTVKEIMERQLKKMVEFAGTTSVGKGYGVKKFTKDDLDLGAAERNVINFNARIKEWEKGRRMRLERLSKVG